MIAASALTGIRLGNYEVQEMLGSGGMASVYRGFDHNLQRAVAIKVLSDAVASQPGFSERFRQEARIMAGLRHAHIVQVYDFGAQDGLLYMVQELLPGPTLAQHLSDLAAQGARLTPEAIISIAAQLASALDAAHAAGVVHRDVKPGNMMWNAAGALVLTDFGIAKNTLSDVKQTQTGLVIGTPCYLSPEQALGNSRLTPASDIYSFGVVLYELIAGRVPFESDTPMNIVLGHIQTPPPPLRALRPDLPPAAEAVVQRALAKNPDERFSSAGDLARALAQAWPAAIPTSGTVLPQIHNQPTRRWEGAGAGQPAPPPAQPGPAGHPVERAAHLPARVSRWPGSIMLPALGALLALLFLAGMILAFRGAAWRAGRLPSPAPIRAAAPAAAALIPALDVTQTVAPLPASSPTPQPTPVPQPMEPLDQLRALLQDGIATGRVSAGGTELLNRLDEAARALSEGNRRAARTALRDLSEQLQKGAGEGTIDSQLATRAISAIDAILTTYSITTQPDTNPQPAPAVEGNEKGGGKGKDKGKGKGKGNP